MPLTYLERLKYYQNPELAEGILKGEIAKRGQIVYGARALNINLPSYLRKHTKDYDVLTKKPKLSAEEIVKKLNLKYGGEYFRAEQAIHKGTYKVISNVTNETIADFTRAYRHPKTREYLGVKYSSSSSLKRNIMKSLKNPLAEFRKEKDTEALQRLKLGEKSRIW